MSSSKTADPAAPPTLEQLGSDAMRHLAGMALVLLAAELVHRAGHVDQQWKYVAIALALLPQVLIDLLATRDSRRRARLRASTRPAPLPLLAALVLAVAAPTTYLLGDTTASALAALAAAVGLAVAASPVTVRFAPRQA